MDSTFNPQATRINAPVLTKIYAYADKTPRGKYRFISFNPYSAKPRTSEGRTCGTWAEFGSAEHRVAQANIKQRLKMLEQNYAGVAFNYDNESPAQEASSIGFIEYLEQRREIQSHANKRRSASTLNYVKAIFPESLKLRDLKYRHFHQLREHLLLNISSETARNYVGWIKGQLSKAAKEFELIPNNPWAGLSIPTGNYHTAPHKKQRLKAEELDALKRVATKHPNVLRAFLFACATGVGRAEIEALTHANIQRNNDGSAVMKLIRQKTRQHAPMECTIPLSANTLKLVSSQAQSDTPLFPPLPSEPAVTKILTAAQQAAGLQRKNLTFYVARHTFICLQIERGTDLLVLRKITGHATLKALMRYAESLELEVDGLALDIGV